MALGNYGVVKMLNSMLTTTKQLSADRDMTVRRRVDAN